MVQTVKMLESLPFPRDEACSEYAGGHRETMDGHGYPKGIFAGDMSVPARCMFIADVFEALGDRSPYKPGKTLSESAAIMGHMKRGNHLDPDLFDLFVRSGVYRDYAKRFMKADLVDDVDEEALSPSSPSNGRLRRVGRRAGATSRTSTSRSNDPLSATSAPADVPAWRCPHCGEALAPDASGYACLNGHRFDRAREGYVNLLPSHHRRSARAGDDGAMVAARRRFLNAGHYAPLLSEAADLLGAPATLLDVGCGEAASRRRCRAASATASTSPSPPYARRRSATVSFASRLQIRRACPTRTAPSRPSRSSSPRSSPSASGYWRRKDACCAWRRRQSTCANCAPDCLPRHAASARDPGAGRPARDRRAPRDVRHGAERRGPRCARGDDADGASQYPCRARVLDADRALTVRAAFDLDLFEAAWALQARARATASCA